MTSETLCFQSIHELAPRLESGALSPVALTEAFLERIRTLDPRVNAFITVTREVALAEAARAGEELRGGRYRGPLHGIPYAVKDVVATRGIRTTWGSRLFENQVPDRDATVIARLRRAGAILLGKLSMNELAAGPPAGALNGPVRNPWNLDHWVHGSSTGPGACVAAGFAAFALGSETTSSILGPASACGVVGFRPTYGRVSRAGVMPLSWTMDKVGPLARRAADCAEIFRVIHGADPADPTAFSPPFRFRPQAPAARARIGVVAEEFAQLERHGLEGPYRAALRDLGALGFELEELALPAFPYREVSSLVWQVESWSLFEPYARTGQLEAALVNKDRLPGWQAAALVPASDYLKALRIRRAMGVAAAALLQRFDALIAPMNPLGARPLEPLMEGPVPGRPSLDPTLMVLGSLTGLPALTVPCGFTRSGLPVGLSIVGAAMRDGRVLELGDVYQRATRWHRERPSGLGPRAAEGRR